MCIRDSNNVDGDGNSVGNFSFNNIVIGEDNFIGNGGGLTEFFGTDLAEENLIDGTGNLIGSRRTAGADGQIGTFDDEFELGRAGDSNLVRGNRNNIGERSSLNIVNGENNNIGPISNSNMVDGDNNTLVGGNNANVINGSSINLGVNSSYNNIIGSSNSVGSYSSFNVVSGTTNSLGDDNRSNLVGGRGQSLGRIVSYSTVSGAENSLGDYGTSNTVSGVNNVLGNGAGFAGSGPDVVAQGNILGGTGNGIGVIRTAGADGVFGTLDDEFTTSELVALDVVATRAGPDGDFVSAGVDSPPLVAGDDNSVTGAFNTLGGSSSNNVVSGSENSLGNGSDGNAVSGTDNSVGNGSDDNAVSGNDNVLGDNGASNIVSGSSNVLGDNTNTNAVSGFGNSLGNNTLSNSVSGEANSVGENSALNSVSGFGNNLGLDNFVNAVSGDGNSVGDHVEASVIGGRSNLIAGGDGFGDSQSGIVVLGADNAVNATGIAGSNVSVLGSNNTVNGAASGFNTVTGHNGTVEGTGNFVAGGNATTGPSATGNDNVVIGAGASSSVDNGVAIGAGSSATLTAVDTQAAFTGGSVGGVAFTEGTDATGGEFNVGERLVTGVADGRVAAGSNDAVNGNQLFQATTTLDGRITANANAIAGISVNTTAIAEATTVIEALDEEITSVQTEIETTTANIGDVNDIVNLAPGPVAEGVSQSVGEAPTVVGGINRNTELIEASAVDVLNNTNAIGSNTAAIGGNTAAIGVNAASIALNTEGINDLRDGAAALASLPDLYLNSDETWNIAGGFSVYDDGFGGTETGFGGGIQLRSSTSDKWSVGVTGAFSGSASAVRFQARLGG